MAGSSPLTRGKLRSGLGNAASARLIPAHAGKTGRNPRDGPRCRAHPRSRGENDQPAAVIPDWMGSSPLTRGKRCRERGFADHEGLIPAHAGKTRQ